MALLRGNLFAPSDLNAKSGEHIDTLLQTPVLRIERIISKAHATPPGQWYDQTWPEWVLVLQGSAGLLLEGTRDPMTLRTGDYVLLPAHLRHRVQWTDPEIDTIWLALHYAQ